MQNSRFFGTAKIDQDTRNVLILSPYIQTKENATSKEIDFTQSLVVDLDSISSNISDQLVDMSNSPDANDHKLLIEFLSGKSLSNSERVLHWMQNAGVISRVSASDVRLTEQNGNIALNELNNMIRKQMEQKEGSQIDVEQYHRDVAEQYNKELNESTETPVNEPVQPPQPEIYPDFGNPSERGKVEPTPLPEEMETQENLDYSQLNEMTKPETVVVEETVAEIDPKRLHGDIIEEIEKTSYRVSEAVDTMRQFEDALSSKALNSMVSKLQSYGKTTTDGVRDVLIDVLSEHYDHVDSDYIRRNLSSADKRLSKKSDK